MEERQPPEEPKGSSEESRKPESENSEGGLGILTYFLLIAAVGLMLSNQIQINSIYSKTGITGLSVSATGLKYSQSGIDLADVDISQIKSTGHSLAALFPLDDVETVQDAINIIIPTGTPEYGEELGISFDDPINSLSFMARQLWPAMRTYKTSEPELWQRYVSLASRPVGISCEFCCGISAVGIRPDGESACGCQHMPALLGLTVWLMKNRPDWSDAEILKEVIRWKAMWFPKNMVGLTIEVAGKDPSSLDQLPGMVGGC